jgi:hypothetical protein
MNPNDSNYRNPFTLLGLNPEELGDLSQLKRAKQRLLAEAGLSEDGTTTLNRFEIEQLFTELEQTDGLDFYAAVAKCKDLDAFLSGSKEYNLHTIVQHSIWQSTDHIREKAHNVFAENYARRLKNAVVAQKSEDLKQLTRIDISNWKQFDSLAFFSPTMHHLEGVLTDLKQEYRNENWLKHQEVALWDYVYTNCSPEILNYLPEAFYPYRDRIATGLLLASKESYKYMPIFFETAQKIASKYKLTTEGRERAQEVIRRTELTAPKNNNQQSGNENAKGCWFYLKYILYFYFAMFVLQLCCTAVSAVTRGCGSNKNYKIEQKHTTRGGSGHEFEELKDESLGIERNESVILGNSLKKMLEWNKDFSCPTVFNERTRDVKRCIFEVTNDKNYVIYVRSNFNNRATTVYAAVKKTGKDALVLLPENEDYTFFIAMGDDWSENATNPCGNKGFVTGNVNYYSLNKIISHDVFKDENGNEMKRIRFIKNATNLVNIGEKEFMEIISERNVTNKTIKTI